MDEEPAASPPSAEALQQPIVELINQSRLIEARKQCVAGRLRFPEDPWLATMAAYVFLICGDSADAAIAASEALGLGSQDPMAWLVLGVTHRNRQRHDEAVEALTKARAGFPERVDVATMLVEETAMAQGVERGREAYAKIFEQLPDHDLTMSWARMLWAAGIDDVPKGAVAATLMSVPQWAARAGVELDFVGEREVIRVEDPPIFGEPAIERFAADVPGYLTYATALRDATIFAKSSMVLTADGAALNDILSDERFGRFVEVPHEKVIAERREDRLLLDVGRYQFAEIEAGVMLSGAVSEHFGHWVPEYLCRLAYLERHPRFADLPIIVDSDLPSQHLEFLGLLVPNRIVQIPAGGALRCEELIVASPPTFFPVHLSPNHEVPPQNQGGLPTASFRFIQERVRARMGEPRSRDRKLYLSRKNSAWRRLLNEEEIAAALAARGFEVIYPEEMSFPEQVRLFQSAGVVVAPNGSSLMNAIYASTDLKLIVLSQRGLFNWGTFNGCMRELGYNLTFLCSDAETEEKHGDYAIPLDRLLEALSASSE